MSEHQSDPKASATAIATPDMEQAALPLIESPTISPVMAGETAPAEAASIEIKPAEIEPVEMAPAETAPIVIAPEDVAGVVPTTESNATQRFRAAAAVQIAAARKRLEQRNTSSVMAVAVMASLAGGVGTVLAPSAIAHFAAPTPERATDARALNDVLTRIEDEIAALRGKLDRAAELQTTQAETTSERLDRIEKAQAEPVAKLGKLVELVEKLRFANVAHATPVQNPASSDITGSIKTPASGAKAKPAIVEGWTLREVDRDAALIEGKRGLFETYVGDTIPGVGKVEGFRKQDGQWVIVTAKGLIVSR